MSEKSKEELATVTLRDGTDLVLRRPDLGDYFRALSESSMYLEQVMLMVTGLPVEKLRALDVSDGYRVILAANPFMSELDNLQPQKKTPKSKMN